jgi:hypothetical protein
MKRIVAALIVLLFVSSVQAQLLTTVPIFPQDAGTVVFTVDCTKGNQGLLNYSNPSDVYVHVGVITNLSASSSDWRYAPFTWGTTNPAAQATSLGNNKYQYSIAGIRAFFGVPAGETIYAVAILFRNGSGSLAQRNTDASDMFVTVFPPGILAGKYSKPPFQPHYVPIPEPITRSIGDTLPIDFITNSAANISLSFNGSVVGTANAQSLQTTLHITTAGDQQVIATASNGTTNIADTISFYVGGASNIAALPAGANEGINYLPGDTSALLVLYAPLKHIR